MKYSLALGMLLTCVSVSVAREPESDYQRHIKPLLKERCFACHGALKQKSGLRLDTGAAIRLGGDGGPAIEVGKAAESLLIERITEADPSLRMPPDGKPLTLEQIALIRTWIDAGGMSPANEQPEEDPGAHWAFQKPVRPVPPLVPNAAPASNPIDAFITAKLAAQGLTPRPLAEKPIILRRLYLDLIGLPPTRDELRAFLADESPTAYETVVDRLLKDPRYGERWARHWMDVWRYSDWYGRRDANDVRNSASQIWRWRDWIVNSLNADHGYDRMVREMLAADEISPDDPVSAIATGYLIRNYYSMNPNDWMRSTVEHTGKAFLGLTFNCAHCHDHKYDPIAHDDYFKLRAFFEPIYVRQDRQPGEADPGPFQEYVYGGSSKVQRLGMVRVFDKTPSAPTWFYTGGDERNRVKERGSIPPGVPEFLADVSLKIEPVELPARAWYPGLRPEIQETVLNDCRRAISSGEAELSTAKQGLQESPPELSERLAQAQRDFEAASKVAEQAGNPRALAGSQSLLLDATAGRRVLQNGLQQIKSPEEGSTVGFQLLILNDKHVNFQLAKDITKNLTASFVGFDTGRILAYQPGSFTEFEAGRYDFAGGQKRFQVKLVVLIKDDRCLLSVRSLTDDKLLVDNVPIALNHWNPVGDATKAITFDARTGSVAAVDDVTVTGPAVTGASAADAVVKARFDFESPIYENGRDVAGISGWVASTSSVAPATSVVSNSVGDPVLREASQKLEIARQAVAAPMLRVQAAEARLVAAQADLLSVEARIAADRAHYGESPSADAVALARVASRLERDAAAKKVSAEVLLKEHALAVANNKPASDAMRPKEIDAASKQLATARAALTKAQVAVTDPTLADKYTGLTPVFPKTSTGRRRALAGWVTSSQNPLTARVAVNHIWGRHFHEPLVATVHDFGRNGARPTHPELLDWLAVEFMESGWSMQQLHRRIVTSAAYRRVSSVGPASHEATADPENKLLWRMNAGRMEAEVVRDSLLYAAGRLDLKPGGQELENNQALTTTRRSLYYSSYPETGGKSEFGELFDGPDPLDCYRRTRSIVPQQALALTNSQLVHQLSATLASALWKSVEQPAEAKSDQSDRTQRFIEATFESVLSRAATAAERDACLVFLSKQAGSADQNSEPAARARDGLVRVILNHNDFVTIR